MYFLTDPYRSFWHQCLRQPLTAVSNYILRDLLCLPRPSILERYTNIFLVFFQSAILHVLVDIVNGIPAQYSGSLPFFSSFALGIMIEDGVQHVYKRLVRSDRKMVSLLERAVGYSWVMVWLGVVSTWFIHPAMQNTPPHEAGMIPFSISDRIGFTPVAAFAAVSGLGLLFRFKAII